MDYKYTNKYHKQSLNIPTSSEDISTKLICIWQGQYEGSLSSYFFTNI